MAKRLRRLGVGLILYSLGFLLLLAYRPHSPGWIFALLSLPLATSSFLLEVGPLGGIGLGLLTALLAGPFLGFVHLPWLLPLAIFYAAIGTAIGLAKREHHRQRAARRGDLSLEELFHRSANLVLIAELEGKVVRSNNRAKELLGKVAELGEVLQPEDLKRVREEMERAIARGEAGEVQVRLIVQGNESLPVELKAVRLDRERVALEFKEVGELLELKRRLHEAEARYRYLIEDAIDTLNSGIILLDRHGRVFWANETVGRFFYIDRDELIGKELKRALAPCEPFFVEPGSFDRVTSPRLERGFTFTLRGRGEERILELVSIPVETEKYKGGWINHYIDLTEVKRLEASLREKTKSLEESNKRLEEFNHVVNHELKGPARRMEAFAQILLEEHGDRLDEEGRDYLVRIKNQALRMTRLMDDLLTLASIGVKKEPLEEVPLDQVLRETLEGLDYMLQGVEVKVHEPLPTVLANRTRMGELFTNLISNAVKYNDKSEKLVEIGWEEGDGFFRFHVRDNGIGIEKQYWDKIFNLFEVLHRNGDYESTGAGLSICKRIVENYGGEIWVESEPGKGSTFYFTIPKRAKVGEPR
ncbi:TPA: PAS domain-containing sensor histidine kinase [Candidatus Bipolaricaulota bacterium]|nr:PAS domain-containing sensor histidine kinase [Candidatus Bipolaricaulota bacterium]